SRIGGAKGGSPAAPSLPSFQLSSLVLTSRDMPHTDLHWRSVRHEEGFYTSEVQQSGRRPLRTFLPTGYEPSYAYPLLVFFHGHGGSEEQILRLAPRLS